MKPSAAFCCAGKAFDFRNISWVNVLGVVAIVGGYAWLVRPCYMPSYGHDLAGLHVTHGKKRSHPVLCLLDAGCC